MSEQHEEIQDEQTPAQEGPSGTEESESRPEAGGGDPQFEDWIAETLAICERPSGSNESRFCPQWWKHPEAVFRFRALYVEYLKAAAAQDLSSWWVQHWDAHARALFDPTTGIFRACGYQHKVPEKTVGTVATGGAPMTMSEDEALESGNPAWAQG